MLFDTSRCVTLHMKMFSGYYICKIMAVIACSLIQVAVTLHMQMFMVANCKILVVR